MPWAARSRSRVSSTMRARRLAEPSASEASVAARSCSRRSAVRRAFFSARSSRPRRSVSGPSWNSGQRAELELALLDALGERGELLLEVADLAVGVLAGVCQPLDLDGLLAVVLEVGAGVGDLDLGVLALADDAGELAGDLLGGERDGLEALLLGHGGERGGALQQLEVELLDLHEGGCFGHLVP